MKCPKCGYKRQKRDDAFVPASECPSCGLVYAKHDVIAMPGLPISNAGVPAHLRKSALDPESLKKARDRVEKRLRNRMKPRPDEDERHPQTLELARKITQNMPPKPDKRLKHVRQAAIDETTLENHIPESEGTEEKSDEALLLNDVVGVQIHDGTQDPSPEALEPEIETEPTSSDETLSHASTDTDPDTQKAVPVEQPETEAEFNASDESDNYDDSDSYEDSDDHDDVQTETVVLETATQISLESPEQTPEVDAPNAPDSMMPEQIDLPPAYMAAASPSIGTGQFGDGLRRLLPIVAWLILFSGVVGAVLSWTTISDVEAGVNIPINNSPNTLPLGLLLGFAYLATGALGFAFFWVSSMINRQLKDIRQLLMAHPIAHISEDQATDLPDQYEEIGR